MKFLLFLFCVIIPLRTSPDHQKIKIFGLKHQPIIVGKLNGKTAYFLLDTGSDITVLNLDDARKYEFIIAKNRYKKLTLSGLTDKYRGDYRTAYNIELFLGKQKVETKYWVFDLSIVIDSIFKNTNLRISGIVGSDVMKRYEFVIDYPEREVRFPDRKY